jgi:hypothetical protein
VSWFLKTLQPAVTEVIGRPFSDQEMNQLCSKYLGLVDSETPIDKHTFRGISAFCERIYADYSLEDLDECGTCQRADVKKNKLR